MTLADIINNRVVKECHPMPNLEQAMYTAALFADQGLKVKVFKINGQSWII